MTTQNEIKATNKFITDDSNAPLYSQFPGQSQPQPAYIRLNIQNGCVDAFFSGQIGNARPESEFNRRVLTFPVNCLLSNGQITALIDSLLPTMQRILDDSEIVWDNGNKVGRFGDTASSIIEELEETTQGTDMETDHITDLADWLAESGPDGWTPAEDADVQEYIDNFDLDGGTTDEDIGDVLSEMWANELYNGEPLQQNVAQYLQKTGHCSDSAWTKELAAYAKGETPE